jgi:hypothetical protein
MYFPFTAHALSERQFALWSLLLDGRLGTEMYTRNPEHNENGI